MRLPVGRKTALSTGGRCLLVALALIAPAGCSGRSGSAPVPTASASVRPIPNQTPTIAYDQTACQGGVPFYSASPPYTGAGPHLVVGIDLSMDETAPGGIVPPSSPALLPPSWAADREGQVVFDGSPQKSDYQLAQLALCMSLPQAIGRVVGTCSYSEGADLTGAAGIKVDVVSASYTFKLFEARTGRLLESFRLAASSPDQCPTELSPGQEQQKIAAAPPDDAIEARLRPFVEGTARTA